MALPTMAVACTMEGAAVESEGAAVESRDTGADYSI